MTSPSIKEGVEQIVQRPLFVKTTQLGRLSGKELFYLRSKMKSVYVGCFVGMLIY